MKPQISIIVATYNRADTIVRTLKSILAQTYQNFEVIIVDDGSTDQTLELVRTIKDDRIRLFEHSSNKGVTATKNTGLNNIKGEWYTTVDSDDEIVPEALETLINIPLEKDPEITAVTVNCFDTSTKLFTGKGLTGDQYLDEETIISKCSGDFWGIRKTEALQNDRFNESICGHESILWYKINARSVTYYIHKALLIKHTEGTDRILKKKNISRNSNIYSYLVHEPLYLSKIKQYNPRKFRKMCLAGMLYLSVVNNKTGAKFWSAELQKLSGKYRLISLFILLTPSKIGYWYISNFINE